MSIGGSACRQPYSASLLNISAMSYGALSGNAISALNLGAKAAGCYHNTGEGGVSRYHKLGADLVWNVGTGYFACGETKADGTRVFSPAMFSDTLASANVKMVEVRAPPRAQPPSPRPSPGASPAHVGGLVVE